MPDTDNNESNPRNILGLSTDELAGLSETDLLNNAVAIRMMLHYYNQVLGENSSLKNTNNTLKTYATAYETKKSDSTTAAILLILSNVAIGFGTNILTSQVNLAGVMLFGMGIVLALAAIFFNFIKEKI